MREWSVALLALAGGLTLALAASFDAAAQGAGGAAGAEATAASPPEACTLETPLVPGVPGSPGHLLPSPVNPNGESELAALMRAMQADLGAARARVERGEPVAPMLARHRRMRCAWPTEPADRNPRFDAFARGYLDAVAALEAAPPAEARAAHDRVLDACKSCHQQTCPGPIAAIEALRLPPGR